MKLPYETLLLLYETVGSGVTPGQVVPVKVYLESIGANTDKKGQTSHFMQSLTSYYCLRRLAFMNDVQETGET